VRIKTGRNDPCPCGSGKKYKHCCYAKDSVKHEDLVIEAPAESVEEDDEEKHADDSHQPHKKDRSRFTGEVKSGSAVFRPRASRGGQRGS
jgi:hypothetical protein